MKKIIYGILDSFHSDQFGDSLIEVCSDNPVFKNDEEFFDWCKQHGADGKWYDIDKFTQCTECGVLIKYTAKFCCSGRDCGCKGMPLEPPWCSKCWKKIMKVK